MNVPAVTTSQMIEVDRLMLESYGITLEQMMENAGRNLADLARQRSKGPVTGQRISVLCGPGNNGGGGMVAGRHLHNMGAQVGAWLAADQARLKDAPAHQWAILRTLRLDRPQFELESSDLILDSLLGYGARGDPHSPIKEWIERAISSGIPILSLDCPSGLDTTTGKPGRPCIRAEMTMTLALPKTGLLVPQARDFVGALYLADISVPPELYRRIGIEVGLLYSAGPIVQLDDLGSL